MARSDDSDSSKVTSQRDGIAVQEFHNNARRPSCDKYALLIKGMMLDQLRYCWKQRRSRQRVKEELVFFVLFIIGTTTRKVYLTDNIDNRKRV